MSKLDYKRSADFKTKFVCDVPINDREVYRISNKEYRDMKYVDLRIFVKAIEDNKFTPRIQGLWIERELLEDAIEGLTLTRDAPIRRSLSGPEQHHIVVWQFYITEWDIYRFYKVRKKDSEFVEIRRMTMNVDRKWGPYDRKGLVIEMRLIDAVISGLKKALKTHSIK